MWLLTIFQDNVTVTNQQTSTESMLDYSQGFSATYFEVIIGLFLSLFFFNKFFLLEDFTLGLKSYLKSFVFLQGRSSLQDHYGFSQPSLSENDVHSNK